MPFPPRCAPARTRPVYATKPPPSVAPEIAARDVETKIVAAEDIAARTPTRSIGACCSRRVPWRRSTFPNCRPTASSWRSTDHRSAQCQRDPPNGGRLRSGRTADDRAAGPPALAKSASGGLEHVPICSVVNLLARARRTRRPRLLAGIGLDSERGLPGRRPARAAARARPRRRGQGMRRLTRERCGRDGAAGPARRDQSLNVSNACAIALALVQLARPADQPAT